MAEKISFIEQIILEEMKNGEVKEEKELTATAVSVVNSKKQGNNPGVTKRVVAVLQEMVTKGYMVKAGGGLFNKKIQITEKGKQALAESQQ
ncbi:hypothetical protein SDC9_45621 [bioreactor metagenome]|uniref:Uncharacterized protein n=1 Tax=bioreactor metagenome TaxID=1076179 RepID=A0A644WAF6_9ZZZZ